MAYVLLLTAPGLRVVKWDRTLQKFIECKPIYLGDVLAYEVAHFAANQLNFLPHELKKSGSAVKLKEH